MLYQVKEQLLVLPDMEMDCISFGSGTQPLVMVQGLNTRGIKGAGLGLAWMYRLFAKDYRQHQYGSGGTFPAAGTARIPGCGQGTEADDHPGCGLFKQSACCDAE